MVLDCNQVRPEVFQNKEGSVLLKSDFFSNIPIERLELTQTLCRSKHFHIFSKQFSMHTTGSPPLDTRAPSWSSVYELSHYMIYG